MTSSLNGLQPICILTLKNTTHINLRFSLILFGVITKLTLKSLTRLEMLHFG